MLPIQMYCPVSLTFELVNVSPRSGVGFSNQLAFLNSGLRLRRVLRGTKTLLRLDGLVCTGYPEVRPLTKQIP